MNNLFTFRQSDEFGANLGIEGATALDCSCNGESLVIADFSEYIRLNIENGTVERKRRSNHKVVSMLKCHPRRPNSYAAISGANVEFWSDLTFNFIFSPTTRVSDFSFHSFNENLSVVASSESVVFVDNRAPKQTTTRLPLLFGAAQAKFTPVNEHLLFTANVADIRCFDTRNVSAPFRQFVASNQDRQILAMELHPTDSNILVTSSSSESKLWNCSDGGVQSHLLDHANIAKFSFSQTGEIFVGLSYFSNIEASVKLWQISALTNAYELRHGVSDFIDLCWQKRSSQNHHLFTLSKQNSYIYKHMIVPNVQSEAVTMREPTKQTAEDEELDQLVLISGFSTRKTNLERLRIGQLATLKSKSSSPTGAAKETKPNDLVLDSNPKSWNAWIKAPSQHNEVDLLFELNSVRKLTVLGLSCNEINFQRAAIGLSYSHYNIYKKIYIEIRFHRNFLEVDNGWVFFELIKKNSPFNSQTAKAFLYQLNDEAIKQQKKECSISILAQTLRQLPTIVDAIHVFPPVKSEVLDRSELSLEDSGKLGSSESNNQSAVDYTSTLDSLVPSPRLSGARFNQNGYLCLFGQAECSFQLITTRLEEQIKPSDERSKAKEKPFLSLSRNVKSALRKVSTSDDQQNEHRKSRLLFNRCDSAQPAFMRTFSDYQSFVSQSTERNLADVPETNYSLTLFHPTEGRSDLENDARRRLSSITLEESTSMSTSMLKLSKSTAILSPVRRKRGVSMTSCITADSALSESLSTNSVIILDTTIFQCAHRALGQHYRVFGGSIAQVCYHNMWAVVSHAPHKRELISLWQLLFEYFNAQEEHQMGLFFKRKCASAKENRTAREKDRSRASKRRSLTSATLCDASLLHFSPIDYTFMHYFIEYYYAKTDVQTSAMLVCILFRSIDQMKSAGTRASGRVVPTAENADQQVQSRSTSTQTSLPSQLAAFDRFIPLFMIKENEKIGEQILLHRKAIELRNGKKNFELNFSDTSLNNSNGNSFEQQESFVPIGAAEPSVNKSDISESTLDSQLETNYKPYLVLNNQQQFDGLDNKLSERLQVLCLEYCALLWQWGLLNQRAEVLKCARIETNEVQFKQFVQSCTHSSTDDFCNRCEPMPIVCMVCDMSCNGLVTVCKICGHGGHMAHVAEYFVVFDSCPCCGCKCRN